MTGGHQPLPKLVSQVLVPGFDLITEVLVQKHLSAAGQRRHGGRHETHRLQQVGVLGQDHQLPPCLLGDLQERLQALDVSGPEVGDDEARFGLDYPQGAVVHFALGVVRELQLARFALLGDARAFAEEQPRPQGGDLVDEALRLLRRRPVPAQVAAVNDPAGGGLHRPCPRPVHGVVDRKEPHRQVACCGAIRREGRRLQPLAPLVVATQDVVRRAGPELLRRGGQVRRIRETERPLPVALTLGLQVAAVRRRRATGDITDLLLEVRHA